MFLHAVTRRFKLAAGVRVVWTRDGRSGCGISMVLSRPVCSFRYVSGMKVRNHFQ